MSRTYGLGILGCGDFLRWEHGAIQKSDRVRVAALYDPLTDRAEHYAGKLGGEVVDCAEAVFDDGAVDVVCLFVPPWARCDLMLRAVEAGKHIITTKPLATKLEVADQMLAAVSRSDVSCAVLYRRTAMAEIDTLKAIFESGEIGKLGLYKHDWFHHYPTWNEWATDAERNGGPFMDAMVHNLNIVRHLAAGEACAVTFFSDTHAHPDLRCSDTEAMKVDFECGASAHLFITWAADLEVYSNEGNDREHLDFLQIVSNGGWWITFDRADGKPVVKAVKDGNPKTWPVQPRAGTHYDRFVEALEAGEPPPWDMLDAWKDIKILDEAMNHVGVRRELDLEPNLDST